MAKSWAEEACHCRNYCGTAMISVVTQTPITGGKPASRLQLKLCSIRTTEWRAYALAMKRAEIAAAIQPAPPVL